MGLKYSRGIIFDSCISYFLICHSHHKQHEKDFDFHFSPVFVLRYILKRKHFFLKEGLYYYVLFIVTFSSSNSEESLEGFFIFIKGLARLRDLAFSNLYEC